MPEISQRMIKGITMENISLQHRTLAELRKQSGGHIKQSVIALEMAVQEPAVSKLERKPIRSMQLEKLQRYIDAIGGKLDVSVTLPDGTVLTMNV
ncbi:DNA-binding protein [Candidatus Poribacteria bacterium]|nr:DNA-binding protein [Candidatus Poribacteria bacterium]|tara:strand:+ start:364 stop:648 length:285 start_codon:yes stop_codon:yes gene_type:complete